MNAPHHEFSSSSPSRAHPYPDTRTVPLAQIRFGHEHPLGDINIRKSRRFDDTEQLAASIGADGILQSLLVTSYEGDDYLYAIAGNRRLHAARLCPNVAEAPVLIHCNLSVDEALALGLAEELPKVPPHAVDRFEAFRAMENDGKTPADIAARYGVSELTVKRALAIGHIPAKIRDAWRKGEINAKIAQLFTLARDDKQAEKTFDRLKKQGALQKHNIRGALVPDQGEALAHVNFVGLDAYRAAGGAVIVDLFDDEHVVSNPELAAELAEKKLKDLANTLVFDEGWSWAAPARELPSDWRSWRDPLASIEIPYTKEEQKRLDELQDICERGQDDEFERADAEGVAIEDAATLRAATPEIRAKAGVVLILNDDGYVTRYIRVKPDVKKNEAAAQAKGKAKDVSAAELPVGKGGRKAKAAETEDARAPALSNAHKIALGITLTEAAVIALREQPEHAALILLAGIAASYGPSFHPALRASVGGLRKDELKFTTTDIPKNLERWGAAKQTERDRILALAAAATLGFNHFGLADHALADPDIAAVCNLLDADKMRDALLKRFDAEDYFAKAPKAFALGAIGDVCGPDQARAYEGKPKSDIVKFALANIAGTGWLPAQLRTAHYAGPGSSAKKDPRNAKAAKAKPAKAVQAKRKA